MLLWCCHLNNVDKWKNHQYIQKVLKNVLFLARQGLPFRGNWVSAEESCSVETDSNLNRILFLHAKDDPGILDIMQRKTPKYMYTNHHTQNELMQNIVLNHLRKIAAMINEAWYFSLESDEVTDT